MAIRTREQQRAHSAYTQVSAISSEAEPRRKAYGRMAHKLPVLIRQAGLAQALSFVEAKGTNGANRIVDHLAGYLKEGKLLSDAGRNTLLSRSREADIAEYMLLTREIQAALLWHKRYAQSVLNVVQGEDEARA